MPSGVPGAASNQPPLAATAPLTGASAPLHSATAGTGSANQRRDSVTNYEVDKTVRVTRNATGSVKRLAAAVVVNHRVTTAANGKTTSTPLSSDEIEKLTALVQESIGFSKERGDSVKLINAPFKVEALPKAGEVPVWQQDWFADLLRTGATPAALALVALLIVFGLVRPALKSAAPNAPAPGTRVHMVADETLPSANRGPALEAPNTSVRLDGARALAKQNPAAVASIVRDWVKGEGHERRRAVPKALDPGARSAIGAARPWGKLSTALDEQGLEDAAILLMSLGEEEAAEVFRHLEPKEVQRLGETIARMKAVPREKVEGVLDRFTAVAVEQSMLVADTDEYVKDVLRKALGDDKANLLIDRILQGSDVAGIESLKWMDASAVAELLRNEHPQIVAAILVHLDHDQASAVLKRFAERQRNEVLVRIATLDGIQPCALKDLNEVMSKVLAGGDKLRKASLGGVKTAAEIINLLGGSVETAVLDYIREADNDLAQKIMDNMFTFDDLDKLDDKGIQALLKEVQSESLVVALKGATPELREKIFKNMTTRAAETLREDLESRGPVRLSEVEAEQKEMLKIVRRLADEGQIVLGGGGDDEFV